MALPSHGAAAAVQPSSGKRVREDARAEKRAVARKEGDGSSKGRARLLKELEDLDPEDADDAAMVAAELKGFAGAVLGARRGNHAAQISLNRNGVFLEQ